MKKNKERIQRLAALKVKLEAKIKLAAKQEKVVTKNSPNKENEKQTIDGVYGLLCSATRPIPAYFTSDYNAETKSCRRPRSFGLNWDQLFPVDEYNMASHAMQFLPNSDLFKMNDYIFSAMLIIAEDIILGSFIITRLGHKDLTSRMMDMVIRNHFDLFKKNGFNVDNLLSDMKIVEYFWNCENMGKETAELNSNEEFDSFMGLTFSEKDWHEYTQLRNLFRKTAI